MSKKTPRTRGTLIRRSDNTVHEFDFPLSSVDENGTAAFTGELFSDGRRSGFGRLLVSGFEEQPRRGRPRKKARDMAVRLHHSLYNKFSAEPNTKPMTARAVDQKACGLFGLAQDRNIQRIREKPNDDHTLVHLAKEGPAVVVRFEGHPKITRQDNVVTCEGWAWVWYDGDQEAKHRNLTVTMKFDPLAGGEWQKMGS